MTNVLVYNPKYVNPNEMESLLKLLEKDGIHCFAICHMDDKVKPLYIEYVKEKQNDTQNSSS